jgi:hypothetical protein
VIRVNCATQKRRKPLFFAAFRGKSVLFEARRMPCESDCIVMQALSGHKDRRPRTFELKTLRFARGESTDCRIVALPSHEIIDL